MKIYIYIFSASPIKSRRHDIEEVEVLVSRHDSDGESMGRHDTQYEGEPGAPWLSVTSMKMTIQSCRE